MSLLYQENLFVANLFWTNREYSGNRMDMALLP